MKYKIYIILSVFSVLSLLSFQNIFAQENSENKSNESIYSYLSAEEAFFIINYSTLDELKIIALALGIKFSDDITLDEIKKLLYEYYNFTEIKQKESEDILFIKSTDILNISDENRVIDLIGNNIIIYKNYLFKADRIIFYLDEETFYGYGNVVFKSSSFNATAESFEYSIPKKNGVFHNTTIYTNNYIISTPIAYISNNDTLITEKATLTQCNNPKPHYYLIADKVLYSDSMIYLFNIQFVIGSEKLLYFPLYISYEKGYNYPLLFGMDYGYREGFMFFNTLIRKQYSLYFDIYERLGFFIGLKSEYKLNNFNYSILGGVALSPDLFYKDSNNTWTIIPPNEPFSLYNINIRAGIYGDIKFTLVKNLIINLKYTFYSDPYFNYDYFLRERFLRFDITQFTSFDWQKDYNLFPSTNLSFNEELQTNFKIFNFNTNLSSSISFSATQNSSLNASNLEDYLYSPKYYQYYLSSIKWYSFSLNGNLLNLSNNWFNFSLSNSSYSTYLTYYNSDKEIQKETLSVSTSINPSVSIKFNSFSYSFTMSNNILYNENITDELTQTLIYSSNINNSLIFQTSILRLSFNVTQSYKNSFLEPTDFGWLSNLATVSLYFSPFSFFNFSLNLSYDFLDETNNDLWVFSLEKFESVILNNQLKFQYLSSLYSSKFYLPSQKFLYHKFNLALSVPKIKLSFFWISLSDNISFKLDQQNPFNSVFENTFNMVFSIEKELQIVFRVVSYNQFLYRYNSFEEAFLDLLNSFNFLDYEARLNSYFNLRSLSLSLVRYLHDMTVQFQIGGSFVLSSDKTQYNFVLSYSIYIISSFLSGYEYSQSWENIFQ